MMKPMLIAALMLVAGGAQAVAPEHFRLSTAGDLARVCGTPATDKDATTAAAFCHGVLAGAYGYYVSVTPVADRFVCEPVNRPTRAQVAGGFVAWLKAHPQYEKDGAVDALFRYAGETYPCKR